MGLKNTLIPSTSYIKMVFYYTISSHNCFILFFKLSKRLFTLFILLWHLLSKAKSLTGAELCNNHLFIKCLILSVTELTLIPAISYLKMCLYYSISCYNCFILQFLMLYKRLFTLDITLLPSASPRAIMKYLGWIISCIA